MANIFVSLPMPAGDGPGPAVDVSAMGRDKSIVAGGSFGGSTVVIEISTDGGVVFQPIWLFQAAGKKVLPVAAQYMRVNVSGRDTSGPFSATVSIGSDSYGALFSTLPVPAVDGPGTPVDVSALGNFTTFVTGGVFPGVTVSIEVSEDGIDYFACGASFADEGDQQSRIVIANFMRTFVRGRDGNTGPYTPTASVGAINDAGAALTDELVKASAADLAAGFLDAKLTPGAGIAFTTLNPGANESVEISAPGSTTDEQVKSSATDTTPGFLAGGGSPKLTAGANIALTVLNPGGDESVEIAAPGASSDELVKVTNADTTTGFLDDKLVAGSGLAKTVINPGGDEDLQLDVSGANATNIDTGVPVTVRGTTNAAGVSNDLARADHDHRLELEVEDSGSVVGARPAIKVTGSGGIVATVTDDGGNERVNIDLDGSNVTGIDSTAYFFGNRSIAASADTRYLDPGHANLAGLSDVRQIPVTRAGTARRLFVRHNLAGGNGNSVDYTVMKNGAPTAITVTLATGAAGGVSDLANTVAVAAGDRLSLRADKPLGIGGGSIEVEAAVEILF